MLQRIEILSKLANEIFDFLLFLWPEKQAEK